MAGMILARMSVAWPEMAILAAVALLIVIWLWRRR
jgi:hypothetical protein